MFTAISEGLKVRCNGQSFKHADIGTPGIFDGANANGGAQCAQQNTKTLTEKRNKAAADPLQFEHHPMRDYMGYYIGLP